MALSELKAQKSFELRDSRDMLKKLRWELNNLFCRQRYDIAVCQYHAFNCAVTAWHVTDWLWQDISSSPELKNQDERKEQEFMEQMRRVSTLRSRQLPSTPTLPSGRKRFKTLPIRAQTRLDYFSGYQRRGRIRLRQSDYRRRRHTPYSRRSISRGTILVRSVSLGLEYFSRGAVCP